ncbi:MAG: sigma-54-dependent Fis family transcriptional regulator [Candidatus Zixiibacteriota bacterium]|nr:MAG: sigma-54-dependent Fis family transcriptional regulator [candidate division Zixibacteria bacterium]
METTGDNNRFRVLYLSTGSRPDAPVLPLERGNIQVTTVDCLKDATVRLNENTYHLIVVRGDDGGELGEIVKKVRSSYPWVEVFGVLDSGDTEAAYGIVGAGAYDCVTENFTYEDFVLRLNKALEHSCIKNELTNLRVHMAMSYGFDNIVGISKHIVNLKETLQRVSATDISLMLTGPAGCGKELVAKVIHYHSNRRKNRFVIVDCATTSEQVLEMQLFGETGGDTPMGRTGFTGLLSEADGGTIFFDDVDRLPASLQPRLMEFLRDFTVPIPGSAQPKKVDVRVISATTVDLPAVVEEGCFSKELFYQLSVLPVKMPGLAERAEDIEMLTEHFLRRLSHETGRPQIQVTRRALDLLVGHKWPGNVREMENTLKRAAALCRDDQIDADDILFIGTEAADRVEAGAAKRLAPTGKSGTLDEGQRKIIIKALSENNWNFTQTAQELGIGRTTLWRKVKKYNLKREKVAQ